MDEPVDIIAQALRVNGVTYARGLMAETIIEALDAAGYTVVPKEPTEAMLDAGCECDAYNIAMNGNKREHAELMAKYPDIVKPKETHGAAPCQTLPIVWRAMLGAAAR